MVLLRILLLVACAVVLGADAEADEVRVKADSAVPASVKKQVVEVTSLMGSAPLGQPLIVQGTQPSLLMATDKQDDIILGGYAMPGDKEVILSAGSTALVLVSMAQGPLPNDIPTDTFHKAVEKAPSFSLLVADVNAAWSVGKVPIDYENAPQHVMEVLEQTMPALIAELKQKYRKTCEQHMTEHAKKNNADPTAYIMQNQRYIDSCIGSLATTKK